MTNEWKARTGQKIERLYAWVVDDGTGEGIIAAMPPKGDGWMPLVGADRERIESFRDIAQEVAMETGRTVCLKVFSVGAVIDQIEPGQP